jgi:hypothetical protein
MLNEVDLPLGGVNQFGVYSVRLREIRIEASTKF